MTRFPEARSKEDYNGGGLRAQGNGHADQCRRPARRRLTAENAITQASTTGSGPTPRRWCSNPQNFGMRSVLLIIACRGAKYSSDERVQRPRAEGQHAAESARRSALPRSEGEDRDEHQAGRDRRALEVLHLAGAVRELLGGGVVAREAADPAARRNRPATTAVPAAAHARRRTPSAAGATPNEITSASESSSRPSAECLRRMRATRPSSTSKTRAAGRSAAAA